MKKITLFTFCLVMMLAVCDVNGAPAPATGQTFTIASDIRITPLTDDVYLYTADYNLPDYGLVPANGLIVVSGMFAAMVNVPWTDKQTAALFDFISKERGARVTKVIPTHFHQDCIGGLAEAHRRAAQSYAFEKTVQLAKANGETVPQVTFTSSLELKCGQIGLLLDYCGSGHTRDNIVVWLPKQQILFGGCLVKDLQAQNLGNIKDADLASWPQTLAAIKTKYATATSIVPGHGAPGSTALLDHTLDILKQHQ